MSIKMKLSLYISVILSIILSANIVLYYYTSRDTLKRDLEGQVRMVAQEIAVVVEQSDRASAYLQEQLGGKLRLAAISALGELDPDIRQVTDEELVKLSAKLEVSHISLLQRVNDDIVVVKSSDPKAVNKGVKELGYWYTALDQLLASHTVTVPQGQKLVNFWSGPLEISTTDPDHINKWGYYNDGSRDYIVSPFLKGNFLEEFNRVTGPETLVNKLLKENPMFFEMTGFNPEYFGRDSTYSLSDGTKLTPEARKPIRFGTYQLPDARDEAEIRRVHEEGRSLMTEGNLADGRRVIKSFIPIPGSRPLVIGIVTDSAAVYGVLKEQLVKHIFISLLLLAIIVATSYLFADYFIRPLDRILEKVNRIAAGDFGPPVTIRGTDEFSLLADRVNVMSGNLEASTARLKETVEELNSTKQYLESFITNTSDSIQVVDLEGRTILTNQAFETMYGWDANEARGERLPLVPEDRLAEMGRINNLVKEGGQVTDVETVHRRKNGSCFDVSTTVSPIRGSRGEVVAVASISRDITGRKQTEEMLRRSEKLSVVGQLAAGVAHEIRNPLTTLRGFVQLQKEGGVRKPAHLDLMLSELDRINFIVSEFMVLSKPHVQSFSRKDLGQILRDIVALLEPQAIMANVVLVTELESGIPEVECVENQLKQVFVNLVKNGLEAMDEGGELKISLKKIDANRVMVRIVDEGCGIPADQLHRLGEPFFTNKESGNGLGLMVSQQIISNHKGHMLIRSEIGKGTCIDVTLPVSQP